MNAIRPENAQSEQKDESEKEQPKEEEEDDDAEEAGEGEDEREPENADMQSKADLRWLFSRLSFQARSAQIARRNRRSGQIRNALR